MCETFWNTTVTVTSRFLQNVVFKRGVDRQVQVRLDIDIMTFNLGPFWARLHEDDLDFTTKTTLPAHLRSQVCQCKGCREYFSDHFLANEETGNLVWYRYGKPFRPKPVDMPSQT